MGREAFAQEVLRHKEKLWGYALQLTRSRAEAEDLLQVTYLRAFERWEQLTDLERACPWLVRTMHRAFVDRYRRRLRSPVDDISPALPDADGSYVDATTRAIDDGFLGQTEARDALRKTLDQLPPTLAQALTLRDVWGFSYEEIAELMDCPIGTVRSRIARARMQMLDALDSARAATHTPDATSRAQHTREG
jgi:RNA polymerase sigma-70 factor (ECF subfamily)